MYYYVIYNLRKGEGIFPDLKKIEKLFSSKNPLDVLKEKAQRK
jgi:hypothetical protein